MDKMHSPLTELLVAQCNERDALRAEVERLNVDCATADVAIDELRAENASLRVAICDVASIARDPDEGALALIAKITRPMWDDRPLAERLSSVHEGALRAEVERLTQQVETWQICATVLKDESAKLRAALEAFVRLESERPDYVMGPLVDLMDKAREALRRE
jgi:hypothetical protein